MESNVPSLDRPLRAFAVAHLALHIVRIGRWLCLKVMEPIEPRAVPLTASSQGPKLWRETIHDYPVPKDLQEHNVTDSDP